MDLFSTIEEIIDFSNERAKFSDTMQKLTSSLELLKIELVEQKNQYIYM